jgi:2-succinyl-5-enolpyruvyl-6-hydroxy-3-cyclohexene-1-carboxylate synthase
VIWSGFVKISEPAIAKIISKANWKNRVLFLGTSLPIRHMDRHAEASEHMPLVAANRGASGIDGIISTACGFALGMGEPLVLVMGDMTFLHDINGLSFLKDIPTQVIMVVINNQGNGIFETLPIAKSPIFERYFKTPHDYDLSGAAKIFGVKHQVAHTESEFEALYQAALNSKQSLVLEVMI